MPDLTQGVRFKLEGNSLCWGETGAQSIAFSNEGFAGIAFELLEEQYGASLESDEQLHLKLRQAVHLIFEKCPSLLPSGRTDWGMLKSRLQSPQLFGGVSNTDIPKDFDALLQKAFRYLERHHYRNFHPGKAPMNEETSVSESAIPYDLSGISSTMAKERFEFVYHHRPTIQQLKEKFRITPNAWRQYVTNTLNHMLKDCSIKHNEEQSLWEVVPMVE